jgi:formate hydrogenlyase subunit 5
LHVRTRVFHKHRGIERRFEDLTVHDGALLAERVEGVASVAHATAYCEAIERLGDADVPLRANLVRVVHAELERVANHLDVVLRLAEAAGLAVAVARFGTHKERVLRLIAECCGSRFGRGVVVPGGVHALPRLAASEILGAVARLERALRADTRLLMDTPSFLDRVRGTGPLAREVAAVYGALGPIGRASGVVEDVRVSRPYGAYRRLGFERPRLRTDGDAQARLRVRLEEMWASLHLVRQAVDELSEQGDGPARAPIEVGDGRGVGWAEAPQGEVLYIVDVAEGRLRRVKPRSASFHNLVLFPYVFQGDILTDFAFIEASFGLSIAGVAG